MTTLSRSELESSPLSDLHALASELAIDGFRRLRKADLVDAVLVRQGASGDDEPKPPARRAPRRRRRDGDEDSPKTERSRRAAAEQPVDDKPSAAQREPARIVEGTVELLTNGSGFVRISPPDPSDDDVYLSAAQARRCELVTGDKVTGPARPARRSERYASLIRVETINGVPADEAVRETRMEDRTAEFPSVVLPLGKKDALLSAIGKSAPIGRGSRVSVAGPAWSGKSMTLRRLHDALSGVDGLEVELVLVGVRPEELGDAPGGLTFAAAADAQAAAVEQAVERGRRVAARGGDAVLLIDTLDGLNPSAARRTLAAARKLRDGGSLTVIATSGKPLGGETTVVALARGAGSEPALDTAETGTLRADLLS